MKNSFDHALPGRSAPGEKGEKGSIKVNLSGRGDKDIDFVVEKYGPQYDCIL